MSHAALRRGQALTEFALVLPLLLLLFFAIFEFGRFVLAYEALNNAVREGARYAIVHGSSSLCPSGPMPGPASPSSCAHPDGGDVADQVIRFGFTLTLAGSGMQVAQPEACQVPGANQVTVCWWPDNARNSTVTVIANARFSTLIPLPLPQIGMIARSSLVVNH